MKNNFELHRTVTGYCPKCKDDKFVTILIKDGVVNMDCNFCHHRERYIQPQILEEKE